MKAINNRYLRGSAFCPSTNERWGFLLVVTMWSTSNYFGILFVFLFVTENRSIAQYGKNLSLGIIKQLLSYQNEAQKIFLRGNKFWLVFLFNFRRLPARKKCMLSIFLRLRKMMCFFSDSLLCVFPLWHPNPPWHLKLPRSPLYLQKGFLPLSVSHPPRI